MDQDQTITLKLEGKLIGPWVEEVTRVWTTAVIVSPSSSCVVDLRSVTFIDNPGRALLADMSRHGARFIAGDCQTRTIIDEIQSNLNRPTIRNTDLINLSNH
jgi:ABC-type transporter Mla MlaB component